MAKWIISSTGGERKLKFLDLRGTGTESRLGRKCMMSIDKYVQSET